MDRFERLPQEVHAGYVEGYLDALTKVRELDARGESIGHIYTGSRHFYPNIHQAKNSRA